MAAPQLVQLIASACNLSGGIAGNNFKYILPNATQSGNMLCVWLSWPASSAAPTISDSKGNTWASVTTLISGGAGLQSVGFCLAPVTVPGVTTIEATFSGTVIPFQWDLMEWSNITGYGNGTGAVVAGPTLATGSFTPPNNNANGGNLVLSYFANTKYVTTAASPNPWAAGSGHTLLEADMTGVINGPQTGGGFNHAAQYLLQATSAAINPGMTATGDTTNSYDCAAVALTVGSTGNGPPSTIYVTKIIHQAVQPSSGYTTATSCKFQIPWTGNLRFGYCLSGGNQPISSVTDSDSYTWENEAAANNDFLGYAENTAADTNATLTLTNTGGTPGFYQASYRFYDIANADVRAFDNFQVGTFPSLSGVTVVTNQPYISPSVKTGLAIAAIGLAIGPGLSVTAPASAVFDYIAYPQETDDDQYDNADLGAHYYFNSYAEILWSWTLSSQTPNSTNAAYEITFASAGSAGVRWIDDGLAGTGTSTMTMTYPSGIVAGDLLVAFVAAQSGTAADTGVVTPSGWTLIGSSANCHDTTDGLYNRLYAYQQIYASGSSQAFAASVSGTALDGVIRAYSGVNQTTPINAYAGSTATTSTSATIHNIIPAITETYQSGEVTVYCGITDNGSETAESVQMANIDQVTGNTSNYFFVGDYAWNAAPSSVTLTYSGYANGAIGITILPAVTPLNPYNPWPQQGPILAQ